MSGNMDQDRSKLYGFKIISILDGTGKDVLLHVLTWGTPGKSSSETLDAYLNHLPEDSTASYKQSRIRFTKYELQQLHQSPSCSQCDITLLFKAIKLSCENVASFEDRKWVDESEELEYLLTCIKNKRNETFHGSREMSHADFLKTAAGLRELLVDTLLAAGKRYRKGENDIFKEKEKVHREVDSIMQEVLGEEELLSKKGDILTISFIEEANRRVRQILETTVHLDPMSFLSGTNMRPHVQTMFCRVRIKESQPGHKEKDIEYTDLLTLVQEPWTKENKQEEKEAEQQKEMHEQESTSITGKGKGLSWSRVATTLKRLFMTKNFLRTPKIPPETLTVESERVYEYEMESNQRCPRLLLVQGVAGSGKTTLLALIIAEYLKQNHECRLKGLDRYHLLFRVQCRDHHSTFLDSFLQQLLPEQFLKYRNLLLPLVKRCQVLFIIDGLDESNENSEKLVHSILQEAKDSPGFTLLCTSRPEKVTSFLHSIPSQYKVIRVEMTGIPECERLTFVLRYFRLINEHIYNCKKSEDDFKELVDRIGVKDQFKLPLNLVFLTWIFCHDCSISADSITQAELYLKIHQLCQQKLLDRLARSSQMDRWTLEKKLKEVLNELYLVSLVGLSRCQLSLAKEEDDSLRSACIDRGLPHQEVLSAFLSLKASWTPWGMQEQYSACHKGLQDFYAALYVVPLIGKGNPKLMKDKIFGSDQMGLTRFQYMLQQAAALLPHPVTEEAAQQVVEVLKETGVRYEEQWLDLIEDTKAAPAIVQQVARHFPTTEYMAVKDTYVRSYTALLPHLPPLRIGAFLDRDPDGDKGLFSDLLQAFTRHFCTRLLLRYPFKYPSSSATSDSSLMMVSHSNELEEFEGMLSEQGISCLPTSVETLRLALLGDEHAQTCLAALKEQSTKLPLLRTLEVHVPLMSISNTSTLLPLPDAGDVTLYLSGLTELTITKAWTIVGAIQPPSGYMAVSFPSAKEVSEAGWWKLLEGMAKEGVKVLGLEAPDSSLSHQLRVALRSYAKKTLGSLFFRRTFDDW